MVLQRINNLWKLLSIKNNLALECSRNEKVTYEIVKGKLEVQHLFNPKFLEDSVLLIKERGFQENLCHLTYTSQKKRFGIKEKPLPVAAQKLFFPKELLLKYQDHDMEVKKDRQGHLFISISPFIPKNVYDILDHVNPIARTFWVKNFFAEGIRN